MSAAPLRLTPTFLDSLPAATESVRVSPLSCGTFRSWRIHGLLLEQRNDISEEVRVETLNIEQVIDVLLRQFGFLGCIFHQFSSVNATKLDWLIAFNGTYSSSSFEWMSFLWLSMVASRSVIECMLVSFSAVLTTRIFCYSSICSSTLVTSSWASFTFLFAPAVVTLAFS